MTTKLDFGPEYPVRPPFFFAEFCRLLSKVAVIYQVGKLGRLLLEEIVFTEDARAYSSAPEFWIQSLADRLGTNRNAVAKAVRVCVDHGWLVWHRKGHRQSAIAFVTIPMQFEKHLKKFTPQKRAQRVAQKVAQTYAQEVAQNGAPSSLTLPKEPSPISGPAWSEVEEVLASLLNESEAAIVDCQKHGLEPSDVLNLISWWKSHAAQFLKPSGALHYGLRHAKPSHRPDWSVAFPPIKSVAVHPAAVKPPADDSYQRNLKRLRQLSFEFEPLIKELSTAEIIARYDPPKMIRDRLGQYPAWKKIRDDGLKLMFLEHLKTKQN